MHPYIPRRSVVHPRAHTSCTAIMMQPDNHNPIKHAHVSSLWVYIYVRCTDLRGVCACVSSLFPKGSDTSSLDVRRQCKRADANRIQVCCCHRNRTRVHAINTSIIADADVTFCRLRHLVSETTAPLSQTCHRDQSLRFFIESRRALRSNHPGPPDPRTTPHYAHGARSALRALVAPGRRFPSRCPIPRRGAPNATWAIRH